MFTKDGYPPFLYIVALGGSCDISVLLTVGGRRLDKVSSASYLNVMSIWKGPSCNTDGNNRHFAVLSLTTDVG